MSDFILDGCQFDRIFFVCVCGRIDQWLLPSVLVRHGMKGINEASETSETELMRKLTTNSGIEYV